MTDFERLNIRKTDENLLNFGRFLLPRPSESDPILHMHACIHTYITIIHTYDIYRALRSRTQSEAQDGSGQRNLSLYMS